MKLKNQFFVFILLSVVWINQSYASRISTVPVPGTKSLGTHLTEINSNFIELYRLIFLTEPGFTGLSGSVITSGTIDEARISTSLVRTTALTTALTGKQDIDADLTDLADGSLTGSKIGTGVVADYITTGTLPDGVIPSGVTRDSELTTALGAYTTTVALATQMSGKQNADADLTTFAGISPSVNIISMLGAANFAAIRALLDLEPGIDFYSLATTDTLLAGKQGIDADLDDLADGSLTGSKIGTGIAAANITTGTLSDSIIPTGITRDTELTTSLGSYTTTSALTTLLSGKQDADADLTDLADGSLTGSKVGTGISAANVTTGSLPDAVIPSAIARDTEITSALGGYTTTATLTTLLASKMGTASGTPDGTKFLRDDMTWQIVSAGGGDDWDANNDSVIDAGYLPSALIVDTELTTALSNYVLTSALTTALSSYTAIGSAASFSSVTSTGPISSTGGADGTRGVWWTNPNTIAESMSQGYGLYPTNTGIHAKWTDGSAIEHDIVIGSGSTVLVDGASVSSPNFDSTGDIDVVATGSNVASNVKNNTLTVDKLTTGALVTSGESVISNDTSVMTTASVINYINTQVDYLVSMKLADAGFTIANYLNPLTSPAAVSSATYVVSGNVYDNGTVPTVEISLNGGTYTAGTITGTVSPWGWNRSLTLTSGANTIDVRVINSNAETIQLPQVTVNYTP